MIRWLGFIGLLILINRRERRSGLRQRRWVYGSLYPTDRRTHRCAPFVSLLGMSQERRSRADDRMNRLSKRPSKSKSQQTRTSRFSVTWTSTRKPKQQTERRLLSSILLQRCRLTYPSPGDLVDVVTC